jgi:hypothetical protein
VWSRASEAVIADERTGALPQNESELTDRLFNNMSALGWLLVECLLLDRLMYELLETACSSKEVVAGWRKRLIPDRPLPPPYWSRHITRTAAWSASAAAISTLVSLGPVWLQLEGER